MGRAAHRIQQAQVVGQYLAIEQAALTSASISLGWLQCRAIMVCHGRDPSQAMKPASTRAGSTIGWRV
jgi:hypothetical protein